MPFDNIVCYPIGELTACRCRSRWFHTHLVGIAAYVASQAKTVVPRLAYMNAHRDKFMCQLAIISTFPLQTTPSERHANIALACAQCHLINTFSVSKACLISFHTLLFIGVTSYACLYFNRWTPLKIVVFTAYQFFQVRHRRGVHLPSKASDPQPPLVPRSPTLTLVLLRSTSAKTGCRWRHREEEPVLGVEQCIGNYDTSISRRILLKARKMTSSRDFREYRMYLFLDSLCLISLVSVQRFAKSNAACLRTR
jgi:hypothetical protein